MLFNFGTYSEEGGSDTILEKDTTIKQFKKDCVNAYLKAIEIARRTGNLWRDKDASTFGPRVGGDFASWHYETAVSELEKMGYKIIRQDSPDAEFLVPEYANIWGTPRKLTDKYSGPAWASIARKARKMIPIESLPDEPIDHWDEFPVNQDGKEVANNKRL